MKKQEFIDLYSAKDDVSAMKISKILTEHCNTTEDHEVEHCMQILDNLRNLEEYLDEISKIEGLSQELTKPYTLEQCQYWLQTRIVQKYVASLEE